MVVLSKILYPNRKKIKVLGGGVESPQAYLYPISGLSGPAGPNFTGRMDPETNTNI